MPWEFVNCICFSFSFSRSQRAVSRVSTNADRRPVLRVLAVLERSALPDVLSSEQPGSRTQKVAPDGRALRTGLSFPSWCISKPKVLIFLSRLRPELGLLVKLRLIRVRADEGARERTRTFEIRLVPAAAWRDISVKRAERHVIIYHIVHQPAPWDNVNSVSYLSTWVKQD
jgi:hypothetical protein